MFAACKTLLLVSFLHPPSLYQSHTVTAEHELLSASSCQERTEHLHTNSAGARMLLSAPCAAWTAPKNIARC